MKLLYMKQNKRNKHLSEEMRERMKDTERKRKRE